MKENYIVPFLCTGDKSREYMLKGPSENTFMTASYDSLLPIAVIAKCWLNDIM